MTTARVAVGLIALACCTAVSLTAQQRDSVRDNAPIAVGTAIVSGVVTTDDAQGEPIRRATVLLAAGDIRLPMTAVTDDAGRFTFTEVAGGNYTIVASKPGYVTSFYGAKKPGHGPGVAIAVLDNQRVGNIRVKMLHGAAITGVVRRQSGQPAVSVPIEVMPVQNVGGTRRTSLGIDTSTPFARGTSQMGSATTDDRGVYRVFGLAPGEYVVMTQGRALESFLSNDVRLVTPAELQWAQSASSVNPASGPAPEAGQTVTYSTVYYPGTPDASTATTITLGANEERNGVDFTMTLVPTAKVTGVVFDSDGQPMSGATVQIQPKQRSNQSSLELALTMFGPGGNGRTLPDGTFTLRGVTPGDYTVSVRAQPKSATPSRGAANPGVAELSMVMAGIFGGGGSTPTLWASEDVSISGRDVQGLSLRLQPGMTVTGKVVYQGSVLPPPTDLTKTRVSLTAPATGSSPVDLAMSMMGGSMATVSADGTFVVKGVVPGQYRTGVLAMGSGIMSLATGGFGKSPTSDWYLKSAILNGRDVADIAFDVRPNEDVSGIVMTFTDKPTEVSGSVIDQAGRAVPDFPIVIFSTDRRYWTAGSRRVQQVRPASDGKYKITALPAGEYYVCAVTDLEPDSLSDPTFLDQLVPGSFKITLAEGEKKVQDLKLQGS